LSDKLFSHLNPIAFLQTFATRSIDISQGLGCTKCNDHKSFIEQLGLSAGDCFETAYREEFNHREPLGHDQYADMIVGLKNKIGGNFSRASSAPGMVRVVSTRCPFGEAVKQAPQLCQMTSSVFGGIAARNFGYAKVILDKRIAVGDGMCEVRVYTNEADAAKFAGDEYHHSRGMIVRKTAATEMAACVTKTDPRLWCDPRAEQSRESSAPDIVGKSRTMAGVLETINVVAPTMATVLITGETGVGKEIIARALHAMSGRWNKRFVAVNCGAIPENLVESVLFGHERGAFTGAYEVHNGLFERAEGGTLFFDEIDSLPLAAQARLLRVLQEGEFERVGGRQVLSADVRVIAAASNQLEQHLRAGTLRTDLYYRLNVVPIHVSPLRERREDIPPLVDHILGKLSAKYQRTVDAVSDRVMARIMSYDWPGNVRELENVLERSFLFSPRQIITELQLPGSDRSSADESGPTSDLSLKEAKRRAAEQVEEVILSEALRRFQGNISETAKLLQLTPRAVHQKLHAYRINPNDFRRKPELRVVGSRKKA
jgi:DNA-binding NtrC family response regulator